MRGAVTTERGMEQLAAQEVGEILNLKDVNVQLGFVTFPLTDPNDLLLLAQRCQLIRRSLLLLSHGGGIEELRSMDLEALNAVARGAKSFAVRCERLGEHDFNSLEVEERVGAWIAKSIPKTKVALTDPDIPLYVQAIEQSFVLGVDAANRDLAKREYRVFIGPNSLKGTIAAGLLRFAGLHKKSAILDPFCGAGVVPIEAALFQSGRSPHHFQKATKRLPLLKAQARSTPDERELAITGFAPQLGHITAAKKNAKIAGVNKQITFSKVDAEWIDLKFGEFSIDIVATHPPEVSKQTPASKIDPVYNELFHQCSFVLKKGGVIATVSFKEEHLRLHAEAKGLKRTKHIVVWSGLQPLHLQLFRKG